MKSKKKSMAVTTIFMVVLLVLALSSATFAWYSASTNLNVSPISATSATSTNASIAFSLDQPDPNASKTGIDLEIGGANAIVPMMPKGEITTSLTYDTFTDSINFNTCTVSGGRTNHESVGDVSPKCITGVKFSDVLGGTYTAQNKFYINNTNRSSGVNVSVAVKFDVGQYSKVKIEDDSDFNPTDNTYFIKTGTNTYTKVSSSATYDENKEYYVALTDIIDYLRVAIFVGEKENEATLLNVWSNKGNDISFGTISTTADIFIADMEDNGSPYTGKANNAASAPIELDAAGSECLRVVVWYDGMYLTNAFAGQTANFSISFTGATRS